MNWRTQEKKLIIEAWLSISPTLVRLLTKEENQNAKNHPIFVV